MIRRLALASAVAALAWAMSLAPGCAHVEAPPGGAADSVAPVLLSTRPDTMAMLQGWVGPVVLEFDEALSEEGLQEAVTVSPRLGPVSVGLDGREIRVKPRRGWRPGIIYQVEVAAGLQDRFSNRRTEPVRLVFSTGPAIPDTRAGGVVTDRLTGQPSTEARVDAVRLADSLIYSTRTDSTGGFVFRQIPEGEYRLRAYRDNNRNQRPDPFEPRDSATVTLAVGQAPTAQLAVLLPDTTPPAVRSARMANGWVEVRFDDYLDPEQPLSVDQVLLIGPDGAAVPLREVRIGVPAEARDTGVTAADSTRAGQPARDTAGADTARPRGPLPSQSLSAQPAAELIPDTIYTVRVRDVRNVNGLVGGGEAPLRPPRPEPPPRQPAPDSVPADSAAVDSVAADSAAPPAPPAPPSAPPPGNPRAMGSRAMAAVRPRPGPGG
ncbi:MAG TPA: Ig-like domain-containing protein [Longimicrobium sp.]|nr:Ig-like domain-containing protein [Longimicrobium sp.]